MPIGPKDIKLVWNPKRKVFPFGSGETLKVFGPDGKQFLFNNKPWICECRNRVVSGHKPFPPGLYKLGKSVDIKHDFRPFGMGYIPVLGKIPEARGLYLHGGGSNCVDPLADYQLPWTPTEGCGRMFNIWFARLRKLVDVCIDNGGTAWLEVV